MTSPVFSRATWRGRLDLAGWAFYARWRVLSGAPGWFLLDALIPVMSTAVPIFLGQAVGMGNAQANFAAHTGTREYAAFLLVGSNIFLLTLRALWDIGLWMRNEQQSGALEVLYTTPADRRWIVIGLSVFNLARGLLNLALSLLIGWVVFQIPLGGRDYLLAVVFLSAGVIPLYALSLLYGVMVLHFKETSALIQVAQAVLTLAMGVYYPISMLPGILRWLALLLPPTWMTQGLRGALLGTGYQLGAWPLDLSVLLAMALIGPPLAFAALRRSEQRMRAGAGLGEF